MHMGERDMPPTPLAKPDLVTLALWDCTGGTCKAALLIYGERPTGARAHEYLFSVADKFPISGSVGSLEHVIKILDENRLEVCVRAGDRTVMIGSLLLGFDGIVETDVKVATIGSMAKVTTSAGAYEYEGYLTVN